MNTQYEIGKRYNCFHRDGTFATWGKLNQEIEGKLYLWKGSKEFDWPAQYCELHIAISDTAVQPQSAKK